MKFQSNVNRQEVLFVSNNKFDQVSFVSNYATRQLSPSSELSLNFNVACLTSSSADCIKAPHRSTYLTEAAFSLLQK